MRAKSAVDRRSLSGNTKSAVGELVQPGDRRRAHQGVVSKGQMKRRAAVFEPGGSKLASWSAE